MVMALRSTNRKKPLLETPGSIFEVQTGEGSPVAFLEQKAAITAYAAAKLKAPQNTTVYLKEIMLKHLDASVVAAYKAGEDVGGCTMNLGVYICTNKHVEPGAYTL